MDINVKNVNEMIKAVSTSVANNVAGVVSVYQSIKWKKVSFTIPTTPEPSHRPRLCGYRVYVPGAARNQAFFNRVVLPTLNGLFISTPCKIKVDIYAPTPKSFTKTQQILAEMKILRPWGNTGDVDNYLKAVMDQMMPNEKRGNVGILKDDYLVTDAETKKYYSKNPRYEVTLTYMGKIPKEIKKILRLDD